MTTLTVDEQEEFARCEDTIRKGWKGFVAVGEALLKIRDDQLYRDQYVRFEDYCQQVWQYQKSQAYRLMDAARVMRVISPIGEPTPDGVTVPTCEAQVRPLAALYDEADIKNVWQRAAEAAQAAAKPITGRLVTSQLRVIQPAPSQVSRHRPNRRAIIMEALQQLYALVRDDPQAQHRAQRLGRQIMDALRS